MIRSNDFNEPYLPERYRQKIRDKQRSRLVKKILAAAIVVAIVGVVLAILAGFFSNNTTGSPPPVADGVPASPDGTSGRAQSPGTTASPGTVTSTPIATDTRISGISFSADPQQDTTHFITLDQAQKKALQIISEKNGGSAPPVNLTSTQHPDERPSTVPSEGAYTFFFERLYHDHPVDTEGIKVTIDAVTGDLAGYDRQWITPDFTFSQADEPLILQRDAIFAVMESAKSRFPASVESIRIISSELRWNNQQVSGSSQRPGSVPLEWKITFSDDAIRADPSLSPAVAWVDIQTGNVTALDYHH